MFKRHLAHVSVLAAALIIAAGPYVVGAAGRHPDNSGVVANVDLQKVFNESDNRKVIDKQIADFGHAAAQKFDDVAALQYLKPDEIKDYSDSILPEKPTDAEKQKAAALKAANAKRVEEAQLLANKKEGDLTPADKTRLRELTATQQQQRDVLQSLQRYFQQLVNEEDNRLMRNGMAEVRLVVGKLAKDQGISQVFDTSSLVYAQIDLTPAALQKVTGKKK